MAHNSPNKKPSLNGRIISKIELCKFVFIAVTFLIVNLNAMRTLLKNLKSQIIHWKLHLGHFRSIEVISIHLGLILVNRCYSKFEDYVC